MEWWRWEELGFGKHKGRHLGEVPLSYLRWVHENLLDLDSYTRRAVQAALLARGGPCHSSPPPPVGLTPTALADTIGQVQRRLAGRFHPDRGGSVEVMQGINIALGALREELKL